MCINKAKLINMVLIMISTNKYKLKYNNVTNRVISL